MTTSEKVAEAKGLVANGMSITAAVKQVGISAASYYYKPANGGKRQIPAMKKKTKKPEVMEFAVPTSGSQKVAIIVTDSANLQSVLGALWQ